MSDKDDFKAVKMRALELRLRKFHELEAALGAVNGVYGIGRSTPDVIWADGGRRILCEHFAMVAAAITRLNRMADALKEVKDLLEADIIASLTITDEKHVAYNDLGTLTIRETGYWKFDDASGREKFYQHLDEELKNGRMTMDMVMGLRQDRFHSAALEDYAGRLPDNTVPGVMKVTKKTISLTRKEKQ